MRSKGTADELHHRRILAVRRLQDGCSADEVAEFLDVDVRSVRRWRSQFQTAGWEGLAAQPVSGRPTKLTPTQTKIVLRWLRDSPAEFGFESDLWTTERLAALIHGEWGVSFNSRYLSDWLRARGLTPQRPQRIPQERNPETIAAWLDHDWPRIKKTPPGAGRRSFSSTKAGS